MLKKNVCVFLLIFITRFCNANPSFQLYGLVDQGLQINQSESDILEIKQAQSNKMASRFGVKGREEFAPNLAVFFHLEAQTKHHLSSRSLFTRRRVIGIEHPELGQVSLGLQSSISLDTARIFDPSGIIRQHGVITPLSGTLNGRDGYNQLDNAIKYTLQIRSSRFTASYALNPNHHLQANSYGLGVSHRIGDTVIASSFASGSATSQVQTDLQKMGSAQVFNLGLAHHMGPTTFKLGFSESRLPPPLPTIKNIGIGFHHQLHQQVDLFTAIYLDDLFVGGNQYVFGSNYYLSKRTHAYGFLHHSKGAHHWQRRSNQSGLTLGVIHRF
jgi:predicted porin